MSLVNLPDNFLETCIHKNCFKALPMWIVFSVMLVKNNQQKLFNIVSFWSSDNWKKINNQQMWQKTSKVNKISIGDFGKKKKGRKYFRWSRRSCTCVELCACLGRIWKGDKLSALVNLEGWHKQKVNVNIKL